VSIVAGVTAHGSGVVNSVDHALARIEIGLIVALLGGAAILNFGQVLGRYAFAISFSEFEEISIYLAIWMVFVGMGRADRLGQSIALDILYTVVGVTGRRRLGQIRDVLQIVLAVIMTAATAQSVVASWQIGETSVSKLAIPIWIVMGIMPAAFLLLAFRTAIRLSRGSQLPEPAGVVE
jgi:TRAP-type C4-dicarboxylate transport system permease small subunit